jgi:hypothetical protein
MGALLEGIARFKFSGSNGLEASRTKSTAVDGDVL